MYGWHSVTALDCFVVFLLPMCSLWPSFSPVWLLIWFRCVSFLPQLSCLFKPQSFHLVFVGPWMSSLRVFQSMWAERGASGERSVRNIVGARSGFLTKGRSGRSVSLRFHSDTAHTTSLGHAQIDPECCVLIFLSAPMLTD